jgi:hypothetical protein
MTIERAMFAFMLQLSFYQNISSVPPLINNTSTLEVLFPLEILNEDFLDNTKPQPERREKALVKLINGTFHHRMS